MLVLGNFGFIVCVVVFKIKGWKEMHYFVSISNVCNLNCPMCLSQNYPQEKTFMSLDMFKYIAFAIKKSDESPNFAFHTINEPILHPNIVEMLCFCEMLGISTTLSSNAQAIDSFIEKLKASTCKPRKLNLRYSIDGGTKETYEIMRNKGKFEKVYKNVKELIEFCRDNNIQYSHRVNYILTKRTAKEIYTYMEKFSGIDFTHENLNLSFLSAHPFTSINEFIKNNALMDLVSRIKNYTCVSVLNSLTIFENGDVGCCFEQRGNSQHLYGNIFETDLKVIASSPLRQQHIDAVLQSDLEKLPETCRECYVGERMINHERFRETCRSALQDIKDRKLSRDEANDVIFACVIESAEPVGNFR